MNQLDNTRNTLFSKVISSHVTDYYVNRQLEDRFNIVTADIESHTDDQGAWIFDMISVCQYDTTKLFYDLVEAFDYLNAMKATVYFHNLDFDGLFFLQHEGIMEGVTDEPLINSGNMMLTFTLHDVVFKNSLSLLPMSLSKVVSVFLNIRDAQYQDDKVNILSLTQEELEPYCLKDSMYLYMALYKTFDYFKEHYDAAPSLTIPSTTFKIYEKHYMPKGLLDIKHRNSFFDKDYYFGGHTEKFVNDQYVFRNRHYYDVNSLYPSEMVKMRLGVGKLERIAPTTSNLTRLLNKKTLFFGEFIVDIDSEALRFFPVLDAENSINKYPLGRQRLKLSEVGLAFILKWGSRKNIKRVLTLMTYGDSPVVEPFKKFVDVQYARRKAKKSNDVVCKLMLNSLYGKFGEKLVRDCKYINVTESHDSNPNSISFKNENLVVSTYTEETPFFNKYRNRLDICGKITEASRLSMGDRINTIRKYGKVDYTDTDSIITAVDITKYPETAKLFDSVELGKLGDEIGHKDHAIILGTKMYHFYKSGKKATKGVKTMDLSNFREIIRGRRDFQNTRFTKLHTLVNRGFFGIQITPYVISNILQRLD